MDEIDVESARLEFLQEQKKKRNAEILQENEGLFWRKPTNENPDPYNTEPSQAAEAFAKTRKIRRE